MDENKVLETAIEKLEAKRAALGIAIAELKTLIGQPVSDEESGGAVLPITNTSGNGSSGSTEIMQDTFFNMTNAAAAKKYLNMIKRPAETAIIAKTLVNGGFLTESKNFTASVHTALSRDSDFVRVKNKWGLSKWYPTKLKAKQGKPEKEEESVTE